MEPGSFKDSKKAKKCGLCGKEFGVTRWKYNCHQCGDVVCDDCSKSLVALPPVHPAAVRVCDLCVSASGNPSKGRKLGGASARGTEEEEREKRAKAAEARMAAQSNRGLGTRQDSTGVPGDVADEKYRLIARIEEIHRGRKEDPPFGLRSFDLPKLKLYLNHLNSDPNAPKSGIE